MVNVVLMANEPFYVPEFFFFLLHPYLTKLMQHNYFTAEKLAHLQIPPWNTRRKAFIEALIKAPC